MPWKPEKQSSLAQSALLPLPNFSLDYFVIKIEKVKRLTLHWLPQRGLKSHHCDEVCEGRAKGKALRKGTKLIGKEGLWRRPALRSTSSRFHLIHEFSETGWPWFNLFVCLSQYSFFLCEPFLKSLWNVLQYCFCLMFWFFSHRAYEILIPWAEIEPEAPALKVLTNGPPGKSLLQYSWPQSILPDCKRWCIPWSITATWRQILWGALLKPTCTYDTGYCDFSVSIILHKMHSVCEKCLLLLLKNQCLGKYLW